MSYAFEDWVGCSGLDEILGEKLVLKMVWYALELTDWLTIMKFQLVSV